VRYKLGAYLQAMTYRTYEIPTTSKPFGPSTPTGIPLLKSMVFAAFVVITMVTVCPAAELPEAPSSMIRTYQPITPAMEPSAVEAPVSRIAEAKTIDKKFVSLAFISTGSTFADSYTTLFARENWLARKQGVCNVEVQSAYLYGTHPTVGRAYAVAWAKSAGSFFAAYYLRKHHSRFWSLPLVANSIVSVEGVTQNMLACN
jgi:hypothetical protein